MFLYLKRSLKRRNVLFFCASNSVSNTEAPVDLAFLHPDAWRARYTAPKIPYLQAPWAVGLTGYAGSGDAEPDPEKKRAGERSHAGAAKVSSVEHEPNEAGERTPVEGTR